jgi:glucosamine--fructose-6-phosphate aminotransferase (isomerizing)
VGLRDEIFQQPEVADRLLRDARNEIDEIAGKVKDREIEYIFLTARGTSDNAGLYAKYLFGIYNGMAIALAAPSIFGIYKRSMNLAGSMVLGISQSGMSPDIIGVLDAGRKQGRMTLAVTNAPDSPLAEAAEDVIDIRAGEEKAVAATKSYTAQLLSIAMLSLALAGDEQRWDELGQVPEYMRQVLALEDQISQAVMRYYYMEKCVVLGRGFNYATTFEWALKLQELAYISADPYSSADFMHGPIAVVDRQFPVMAVMPQGAVYPEMMNVIKRLKEIKQASLLVLSNQSEVEEWADVFLKLPEGMPEWISPMVSIIAAQLFCYHLARIRGIDTESPRGLTKVTETL